jgi:2'-5' RNA ligase
MDKMRCFIAVELPSEVKGVLGSLEMQLREGRHGFVKWVHPENIHITLKFLGATPVGKVQGIIDALTEVSRKAEPFTLRLGELGCFPNMQRPQVLWVGLEGELDKLVALQGDIEDAMQPLGFDRESRSFAPHLTLARTRQSASLRDKQELGKWISVTEFAGDLDIEVDGLSLMESQLTPSGPVYNRLMLTELG